MSGKEHEPGPRGSPQLPQAPEAEVVVPPPFVETAKTESWGARSLLLQLGQTALSRPNTRASNPWWHWLQTYSKIGIRKSITASCPRTRPFGSGAHPSDRASQGWRESVRLPRRGRCCLL